MCAIEMDLTKAENLDFAIYNLILQQGTMEFTEDVLIDRLKACQEFPDEILVEQSVKKFLHFWVERDLLQQHWNKYSLA